MRRKQFVLSRLVFLTTAIYVLGGFVSFVLAYVVINDSMLEQNQQNLEAVLESRARLVEDYFKLNQEQVSHLSQLDLLSEATRAFTHGFETLALDLDLSAESKASLSADLLALYEDEFRSQTAAKPTLPLSEAGRLAQWVYLAKNPNEMESRNDLHISPYASEYENAHRNYHPKLDHFLKSFDFRDVFLFDLAGNLVYSTQKEVDFATNLIAGPHSASGLGRVYRGAMAAKAREVVTVDFESYAASHLEPAAFIASPIFDGERRIGAIAFQLSPDKLNSVISDLHGLGDSGETYIVGNDFLMRTDSRFAESSTILAQRVDTRAAKESIRGQSGSGIFKDYRGIEVLSHYRPLLIDGLNWGIIAEVDRSDVLAPALNLAWSTIAVFAITLGIIAFVSVLTLRICVMRPLSQLLAAADKITSGDYSARVHMATEDEFKVLAESHNQMADSVQSHIAALQKSLAEVKELQGLLPMCSSCKSIRDGDGYFRTVETYLVGKSKIEFSHTICDDCMPRLYPELDDALNA